MKMLNRLFKKSEGYSWLVGMWFAIFVLTLSWVTLQWYSVSENCDRTENIITEASLASLEYDTTEYALSKDKVLKEFRTGYHTNTNYWLLCGYIEKNLGYKGNHTDGAYNNTQKYYNGTFTVTGDYLGGQAGECRILKAIFYNVTPAGTGVHEYNGSVLTAYNGTGLTTPKGDTVTKTSVYVDFEFPVKFAGNIRMVRRQVYVSLTEQ